MTPAERTAKHRSNPINRARANERSRLSKAKNIEKTRESALRWQRENPGRNNANNMRYYIAKMNRIPPWANLDVIKLYYIYANALNLTVDHIIPLRGKFVSGLHIENNLQLIPSSLNSSKGNCYDI